MKIDYPVTGLDDMNTFVFREYLNKMYDEKYPQTQFALHTNSEEVRAAYKKMVGGEINTGYF